MSMPQIIQFFDSLTRSSLLGRHIPANFSGQVTLPKICTQVNAKSFSKLKFHYPTMKKLILPQIDSSNASSVVNSITDACMKQIAKFNQLEQIRLSSHIKITDVGIATLATVKHSPLVVLDLDNCHGISTLSFQTVLNNCTKLKSLSMLGNGNTMLEKKNFDHLIRDSYEIQELRVDIGSTVTIDSLLTFVSKCRKLKSLYLRGCSSFNSICVEILAEKLKYLENLTFVFADGVKLVQPRISSSSLKSLHISRPEVLATAKITCPQLISCFIDQCRDLQHLQFSNCTSMTDLRIRSSNTSKMDIGNLFGLKDQLKELELFDCRISSSGKIHIESQSLQKFVLFMCNEASELYLVCPKLHTLSVDVCLELERMKLICPILETVQLFVLPQIQPPKLTYFALSSNKLTSLNLQRTAFLNTLSLECEQLDSLNMAGCKDLKHVLNITCPKLDKLALGSSSFDFGNEEVVQKLTHGCPNISMLSISNAPQLYDQRLQNLCSKLHNLQALVISNCNNLKQPKLVAPTLRGVQMTDCHQIYSLGVVSQNLSKVFLRNCAQVSDMTLQQISSTCPNVKFLEIFNCPNLKNPTLMCKELTDLHFSRCDQLEAPTLNCPMLKKLLFISNAKIRDLHFAQPCDATAELLFSDCPQINDSLIGKLQYSVQNIQAMVFAKCENIRRPVISFPHLKIIRFSECPNLIRPQFKQAIHLHVLSFQDCPSLDMNSVRAICSDSSLIDQIEITQCDHLQMLQIDVPSQRLQVSKCENLQDVVLYNVSEKIKIEDCPVLLKVWSPQVCALQLQECNIRSCVELCEIRLNSSLKKLELVRCPRITDLTVTKLLNKCKNLEQIEIVDCTVNPLIIQEIISHSRGVQICDFVDM